MFAEAARQLAIGRLTTWNVERPDVVPPMLLVEIAVDRPADAAMLH